MQITEYRSGKKSYDFKVSKRDLIKLLNSFVEDYKAEGFWLS